MKLYNTLSRKIEPVKPRNGNRILMYTCGLTVYSQPQIGNWVAYIYSDVLTRVLKASGYDVYRIQNITDVGHLVSDGDDGEDKMEKGARTEGLTAWDVADKYIAIAEHEAYEVLELLRPDKLVRATDLIQEQIAFVNDLYLKGFTYVIPDEGVYFDTSKLGDYGKLAKLDIKGLQAGARVDVQGKKNITDFALWKFSPPQSKRDMEWDSPWGKGFPGWHLECSVIARESLGDQLDIHTGGIDHIPVHHTNEIAQTESLTGKEFVKLWFHNNHIKVNGARLAKSAGNSYTLEDLQKKGINTNSFKLLVLSSSYRTEGNFSWEIAHAAHQRLVHWQAVASIVNQPHETAEHNSLLSEASKQLLTILQNDLDTPAALSFIDKVFNHIHTNGLHNNDITTLKSFIETIDSLLGVKLDMNNIDDATKQLISLRDQARHNKNWNEADRIRDKLLSMRISVNDGSSATQWYRIP